MKTTTPGNLKFNRWAWAALALGVFCSALGAVLLQHSNQQQAASAVAQEAQRLADTVLSRIALYQYGLRGARGAVLTAGEDGMSRALFLRYSRTRDLTREFVGARGFGFIRRVPHEREESFLRQAREDGAPDFAIRELSANPGERYVIQYIEPQASNLQAVGLDIASDDSRRQAAVAAMRSGEARLTAPITLVQATGESLQSFLFLMPIYRGGVTPASVDERERQLFGWSYAPLLMSEVLANLLPSSEDVYFQLSDITEGAPVRTFFTGSDDAKAPRLFNQVLQREVFGRHWQIEFGAHPAFVQRLHQVSPLLAFALGSLTSLLLAALLGAVSVSRRRRHNIVEQQARLAAIVESSNDAIIGTDLRGEISTWNAGAEKLFGYSAEQAVGRSIAQLLVPQEAAEEESRILAVIARGESVQSFDTQRLHQDGRRIDVSVSVAPIRGRKGNVVGASKTLRDITAKKAAEARIHELNSNLEQQVAARTAELHESNLLLSSVLRSASELSIIATDVQGNIRIFNQGAERLLGYSADEMVGRHTPRKLHVEEELELRAAQLSRELDESVEGFHVLSRPAERDGAEVREWTYVRKDGSRVPVNLMVTAIRDDQGSLTGYLGIATDITERKAAEERLKSARDQLALAAEVANLGIWSWDLADDSLQWNEHMFALYEQPPRLAGAGLNFEHWRERLHPQDRQATLDSLWAAVEGSGAYVPTFRLVLPSGRVRYVQAGARVERAADGTPLRVTGINLDITHEREMQATLRLAKEQADAANAAKSSFLANMSHEIRTPMNAVLGMLYLTQQTHLDARQRDYVDKAHSAATSLLGLLNDILDYSKIEAGKLQLDLHPFEPETLLRDLAVVLSGNLGDKDVEVLFDLDPALPGSLLGDALRLQQILINLAGNAIKFTSRGQVVVSVHPLRREGDCLHLRIAVSDSGIGISEEQLQRIFESFTQAEASTTRRFGGTGLGLFICQRLVELMGGKLQVESRLGVGSRFWFDLPLPVVAETVAKAPATAPQRPLRLLVADDNASAGEVLVRTCEALGWRADLVSGGLHAVLHYREARRQGIDYDVVLMDWRMPDLDGLQAARQIQREASPLAPPTIIMITAYGREVLANEQDGPSAPFMDFLTKPVTPRQLADSVRQVLGELPAPAAPAPREKPRRLAGRRLLVVEDNALNRQVAAELLASEGATVLLAEDGLAGVSQVCAVATPPDAVLMDMQMPGIDGLEATRRIRADGRFAELPILAMTANASQADRQACLDAGMNDHIAKPIDKEQLVRCLLAQLGAPAIPGELRVASSTTGLVESREAILDRFGGDEQLVVRVLRTFEPEMEKLLARLEQQQLAGDAETLAGTLHTLKGSAGTMGARVLGERAAALEAELLQRATEDPRANLEPQCIQELRQLLGSSVLELQGQFSPPDPFATPGERPALSRPQARQRLDEVLMLLEAGNLEAVARFDALARHQHPWPKHFKRLHERIQSLDFGSALRIGREMFEEL